jgi:hypothetical protein
MCDRLNNPNMTSCQCQRKFQTVLCTIVLIMPCMMLTWCLISDIGTCGSTVVRCRTGSMIAVTLYSLYSVEFPSRVPGYWMSRVKHTIKWMALTMETPTNSGLTRQIQILILQIPTNNRVSTRLKKFLVVGCHAARANAGYVALTTGTPRNPGLFERSKNRGRSDRSFGRDRSSEFSLISRLPGFLGELDRLKKSILQISTNNRVLNQAQKVLGCKLQCGTCTRRVRGTNNRNTQEPGTIRKVRESGSI